MRGTAIGTGLAISVNRLRAPEAASKLALLTDGENNACQIEPMDVAQLATSRIRVYTIGVHSGKAKSPWRFGQMAPTMTGRTSASMKRFGRHASLTGARYFRHECGQTEEIYKEIDALKKTEFNVLRYQRKSEASAGWIVAILGLPLNFCFVPPLKSVVRQRASSTRLGLLVFIEFCLIASLRLGSRPNHSSPA